MLDGSRWDALAPVAESRSFSPMTTSMGRLFDAVAALCGLVARASYEGQAAVELEAAAHSAPAGEVRGRGYELSFSGTVLDARPVIVEVAGDLLRGVSVATVAARFHSGIAAATAGALLRIAATRGLDLAVLGGGVFQNRMLLELVAGWLERDGLRVLIGERLPCNDGGIAFGQAAIAAAALEARR
jgi:hydrogenase maturation protein HypF